MMSLTLSLFTKVSHSGPHGPLVMHLDRSCKKPVRFVRPKVMIGYTLKEIFCSDH